MKEMEILNMYTEHLLKVSMTSYRKSCFFVNLKILLEDLETWGSRERGRENCAIFDFGREDGLVISKSCSRVHGCPSGYGLPTPTLIREALEVCFCFVGRGLYMN